MSNVPEHEIHCLICGANMTGVDPAMLILHALINHPIETLSSPKVQEFFVPLMRRLGGALAERLKR